MVVDLISVETVIAIIFACRADASAGRSHRKEVHRGCVEVFGYTDTTSNKNETTSFEEANGKHNRSYSCPYAMKQGTQPDTSTERLHDLFTFVVSKRLHLAALVL